MIKMIEKQCDVIGCSKKFQGHTEKQVDQQMSVHKLAKHEED